MNIRELFYFKLFQEKIQKRTPLHCIIFFKLLKEKRFFSPEEIQPTKQHTKIINQLNKAGLIQKNGQLVKIREVEKMVK